jgi:glyoxylase-like metal-dependent hydrolase (beta-lactamase superfamily II)
MNRLAFSALLVCNIACAQRTPEQQFADDLAAALGGRERVLAVRTLVLEGEGRQFNLGQDMRPGASDQTFALSGWKRQIDLAQPHFKTELTRTPNFAYFQGQAPQRQVQGLAGPVGYTVAASGTAARIAAPAAEDRRAERYHHPLVVAAAALAPTATISSLRAQGAERFADLLTGDGVRLLLAVDANGLPTRVESRSYHINLGDVIVSTHFADYQERDGLKVPARLTTKVDDFTTGDYRITSTVINGTVDDLAAPAAVAQAPIPTPAPPTVVAEAVAPGVWLLGGQTHHSVLVELSKELLLVDAPQSEARTLAAIAKARELQPAKPLTKVITTHHHFDHTAGIRAAIAEGLTIVTHQGNRTFFEEMAKRPHSIVADALSKKPGPVTIQTVDDELAITDAARTVNIYHVAGNPHSDTMLMVYLPAERVIVEVDAFTPGSAVNPYAANLLENIDRRKLRVDRIVPLHGTIAPFAELVKLRGAPTPGA